MPCSDCVFVSHGCLPPKDFSTFALLKNKFFGYGCVLGMVSLEHLLMFGHLPVAVLIIPWLAEVCPSAMAPASTPCSVHPNSAALVVGIGAGYVVIGSLNITLMAH